VGELTWDVGGLGKEKEKTEGVRENWSYVRRSKGGSGME
jgi:hypothetical protein